MGAKRKPAAIHNITGRKPGQTASGRAVNLNFPQSGIPIDPDIIPELIKNDRIASQEWCRIVRILNKIPGWVEDSDMTVVLAYVSAFSHWHRISEEAVNIRAKGDVDEIRKITASMSTATRTLMQIMSSLGFTPADRARIVVEGTKAKNAVDDFKKKYGK